MPKSLWLTPEEMIIKKKRKRALLYAGFVLTTILLSVLVTILANQI